MKHKQKKLYLSFYLFFLSFSIFFLNVTTTLPLSAQTNNAPSSLGTYIPLTPDGTFEQFGIKKEDQTDITKLLIATFRLALGAAAALSVIMITYGGLEYLSTDSIFGQSEGKKKITNAIKGLILAIMAWLILYIINPDTLEFKFFNREGTSKSVISSPHA
jgi:hypothetical protein